MRTAILSLASTPGVWFDTGAAEAGRMARDCNDYGPQAASPQKLGLGTAQLQAIESGNAIRLMPRLKA